MAKGYYIYEVIPVVDVVNGQTVFKTSKPYIAGTLQVYLNGLLVRAGLEKDYVEEDSTTIRFNYTVTAGNEVIITSLFSSEGLTVDVIGTNRTSSRSLYTKFSTAFKLKFNNRYRMEVAIKDKAHSFEFTSKFNPYYTTISKIRLDTGDLLEGATDEQIGFMIYLNSKEASDLIAAQNTALGVSSLAATTVSNSTKAWVRYKTNMDLVNAVYLSLTGVSGQVSKQIGDIQIDRTVKIPYLKDMLDRFKQLFKPYDELIRANGVLAMQAFVKASTTNTYTARGTF